MIFTGISRVFSTENEAQYETIGKFWDELSCKYGISNLRGLGYNWTDNSIEYVIGLKEGVIDGANINVELPDDGWVSVTGRLSDISNIYDEIYKYGRLNYEIELFDEEGNCEILYYRVSSI